MKQLTTSQSRSVATLSTTTGTSSVLATLRHLRDDYGAVVEDENGWTLTYQPEWLDQQRLQQALGRVVVQEEVSSTNQRAKRYSPPLFLLAEHQLTGRGCHGRRWLALPGDAVLLSAVLSTPPTVNGLSVALGAMLWRAFAHDRRLRLKWPNDILDAEGAKVAGILTEVSGQKMVIGVGLNRGMTDTLARRICRTRESVGSLNRALSIHCRRNECAITIGCTIQETVQRFAQGGFSAFQSLATSAHLVEVGESITWNDGRRQTFLGFDQDGALLTKEGCRHCRYTSYHASYLASC